MDKQDEELRVTVDGVVYSHKYIVSTPISARTEFEENILAFCRAWLVGEKRFTITTSGSTGKPKRITLTRDQMVKSAQKLGNTIGFKPGYTALVCLDSRYIAGQMMLARSFVIGMNSYAVSPSSNPLSKVPENIAVDVASFVPYQLSCMLNTASRSRLDNMHCILVGGAPISPSLTKEIATLACPVYATYGMTETAAAIALQKCNGQDAQNHFHSLPGILVSQNSDGCLIIEADYLPHKVVTRDRVAMKGENQFQWLGRQDNIINSGGIKIIPELLEHTIQAIFNVLQLSNNFFVAGLPDRQLGERTCLVVEGQLCSKRVEQVIMEKMKAAIPTHETPKEIRFIQRFAKTKSGKIDRKKMALWLRYK